MMNFIYWLEDNREQLQNIYDELLKERTSVLKQQGPLFLEEINDQFEEEVYRKSAELFTNTSQFPANDFYDKIDKDELITLLSQNNN